MEVNSMSLDRFRRFPETPVLVVKCQECKTRPAEHEIESDSAAIAVTVPSPLCGQVTEHVRLRPGVLCDDCMVLVLKEESDRLADREQARWMYREELRRRQVSGDPARC